MSNSVSDAESERSGDDVDMGSDFEVVDECDDIEFEP